MDHEKKHTWSDDSDFCVVCGLNRIYWNTRHATYWCREPKPVCGEEVHLQERLPGEITVSKLMWDKNKAAWERVGSLAKSIPCEECGDCAACDLTQASRDMLAALAEGEKE